MTHPDAESRLRHARAYDDVAPDYEAVSAPRLFDGPARELVAFAAPAPGDRVLDVGTGTGAVAAAASAPGAIVTGVDPSLPMLMAARRRGIPRLCAGALPHLPFADGCFDVVLSAFVMTHLDDPDAAAVEMRRVLRPGGRIALSAWAPAEDEFTAAWAGIVGEFVAPGRLAEATARVMPSDARFSRAGGIEALLAASGFDAIVAGTRELPFELTIDEWIAAREVCASGRALRALLSADEFARLDRRARAVLRGRFPGGVNYRRPVFLAAALNPAR